MNKIAISAILLLLLTSCNSEKAKSISNDAYQQAQSTTRGFPQASRNSDEVICVNCRAKFKASSGMHKIHDGHDYIACPVCHHDYLKKRN